MAARRLGIDPAAVTLHSGDSARDVPGFGAVASRSAMYVGGAVARTADAVIEKGKRVAAMLLQANEADVAYGAGKFSVKNREVSLFEVAERAAELKRQGVIPESLDTTEKIKAPPSFPNGCHVAEVEIDADTGALAVVNYVAVGDCGNVLDDMIVTGQIHGGVAQGLGQALAEQTIYDAQGQLVSGSFMDYAHAARRRRAGDDRRAPRGRLQDQSARREGHRRGRHHGGAAGADQCHPRRAADRHATRHAGDTGADLAGATNRPITPPPFGHGPRYSAPSRFEECLAMRLVRPLLLLAALVALAACSGFEPEQPSFYRDISQGGQLDGEAAASMISGYRSNNGLPAVTLDADLTRMAQAQAELMAKRDKLEHNIKTPFVARLKAAGYDAKSAAENIGAGYHTLAEAFSGWRDSPPHRANMLLPGATRIGIAAVYTPASKYQVYWTLIIAEPEQKKG